MRLIRDRVDFVDRKHDRRARREGARRPPDPLAPKRSASTTNTTTSTLVQHLVSSPIQNAVEAAPASRLEPGRIDEHELRVRLAHDTHDRVARGLRPRRGNAELLTDERFMSVDLPTLGRPIKATYPLRVPARRIHHWFTASS